MSVRYDGEKRRIYVRQSWLGDALLCPERARLGMLHPERRSATDATIMGTAVHSGIEASLSVSSPDFTEVVAHAVGEWRRLSEQPYRNSSGIAPDDAPKLIESMLLAFTEQIRPQVELGGTTEYRFQAPIGVNHDGWEIWVEGTMDYVSPSGKIWDWKTAKRAYNRNDKQEHSVQASVYAHAAGMLGLVPDTNRVEFGFGVMIRQETPKAQVVDIVRTLEHSNWLRSQIQSTVITAHTIGSATPWLKNDQNNLCSAKWCDHWDSCKGMFIKQSHLEVHRA
jgi:hypothetical protein